MENCNKIVTLEALKAVKEKTKDPKAIEALEKKIEQLSQEITK